MWGLVCACLFLFFDNKIMLHVRENKRKEVILIRILTRDQLEIREKVKGCARYIGVQSLKTDETESGRTGLRTSGQKSLGLLLLPSAHHCSAALPRSVAPIGPSTVRRWGEFAAVDRRAETRRHSHQQHNALHLSGLGSLRKQGEPGLLSDSLFGGNRLCTPRKSGRTPMKMLIDDEVVGDVSSRHTSPGVVGKLMGLDIMPSFGVHSQNTCSGNNLQNVSPGIYSDKQAFSGNVPHGRSNDEIPEFKDVFEVMETTAGMSNQSPKTRNSNTCSGLDKINSADLHYVRQKFMDAKRLSTDKSFQRSTKFNDALEALVSNKDLMMEILEESSNVVTSDLSNLNCPPSSGANRITVLKPYKRNKFIDADIVYPSEQDTDMFFHAPREAKHSPRKPYISQPTKKETDSSRQTLSRSSYRESIDKHISPTRIVVLKPCLQKTQNMEGAFPLTDEMFCSSYRRTRACLNDSIQRRCAQEKDPVFIPQMSTGDSAVLGHRRKGSKDIAREVTTQMRRAVKGGVSGNQILNPDIGNSIYDEQVSSLSSVGKQKSSEAFQRSFDASCFGASPTHSTKASIRKETRRRLSDRWKMTHQYQHPSQDANTFSTLGDMLALSDKEASKVTSGATALQKCEKGELHRDVMPGSCGYPLGISSNDGWKDESACSLTRSKSSSSPINRGSPKLSSKKVSSRCSEFSMFEDIIIEGPYNYEDVHHSRPRRSMVRSSTYHSDDSDAPSLDEPESVETEREIHVNFEKTTYNVTVPELYEAGARFVHPTNSNHDVGAELYLYTSSAVPEWQDEDQAFVAQNKVMDQEQISTLDDHLIPPSIMDSASQTEGNSHDQCEDNKKAPSDLLTELVSHVSSAEDDQPSPVPVLQSSLDSEDGYSGGFEKISADLQELRMQLRLLKLEATENADDTDLVVLSDDDSVASCKPVDEIGLTACTFWDEDERDFSYLVDMLTCLGIRSDELDLLLDACYLSGFPVGSDVYDSLEKKYSKLILWPRSERRLLFDLANDALLDIITCLTHRGTQGLTKKCWLKQCKEGLVEEVWERVCRQRQEMECFQEEKLMGVGWLDCEDVTDQIAREIGSMLNKDLLEEVVADLMF